MWRCCCFLYALWWALCGALLCKVIHTVKVAIEGVTVQVALVTDTLLGGHWVLQWEKAEE